MQSGSCDDGGGGAEYWRLRAEVYEIARKVAAEYRLRDDDVEVVADSALDDISARDHVGARPSESVIRRQIRRHAARRAMRLRRETLRLKQGRLAPRRVGLSAPPLCSGFVALARIHPTPAKFLSNLYAASIQVSRDRGVLRDPQLRIFLLAYEDRRPIAAIAKAMQSPSHEAAVERVRRVSRRIEQTLVGRIAPMLTERHRCALDHWIADKSGQPGIVGSAAENSAAANPLLIGLCAAVDDALRSLHSL